MGVWGTGLYSNDIAEDVRDMCNEIFPFVDIKEGNKILFTEFSEIVNSSIVDNDSASFWYALADWQWKHGILSEAILIKTLELLENYTGIEEWKESGTNSDVKKRIAVLEKLQKQLRSPMPPIKLPKARLAKPKHKPGDIIIFKSCSKIQDEYNALWTIDKLRPPFMFADPAISNSGDELNPIFEAYEKYMALLCVGTEKVLHSEYLHDLYDENSVYVYYDFANVEKPTLVNLKLCGFLPQIYWTLKDFNKNITEDIGWTYEFTLLLESFKVSNNSAINEIDRIYCNEEVERYFGLWRRKSYLKKTNNYFELFTAFSSCWKEKKRLESLGIEADTLLSGVMRNPAFLCPSDVDAAYKQWMKFNIVEKSESGV